MASAGMCSPRSDHNCEDKAPLRMRDGKSTWQIKLTLRCKRTLFLITNTVNWKSSFLVSGANFLHFCEAKAEALADQPQIRPERKMTARPIAQGEK